MLDSVTYIEIKSFVSLQGRSTVVVGLRAFSRLERGIQYFIAVSVTGTPRTFHSWQYKTSHRQEKVCSGIA